MRTKYFHITIALLLFISCKTEDSTDPNNDSYLLIEGITSVNEFGEERSRDPNDWILNDKFTTKEKELFDSLNFSETATAEPMPIAENSIYNPTQILFYPNPCATVGSLYYYHDKHILNVIIVDNKFKKLIACRLKDSQLITFDLSKLSKGIYRLYYVVQDSKYKIVHYGHGDIEKE